MGRIYPTLPVEFPIELKIKQGGKTFTHVFHLGDKMECRFCKQEITLDNKSVFRFRHLFDNNARVQCGTCGLIFDLAYYADEKNRTRLQVWDSGLVKTTM